MLVLRLLGVLFIASGKEAVETNPPLTAIVTAISGRVETTDLRASKSEPVGLLRWQILKQGITLDLAENATLTLVLSTDVRIFLEGRKTWTFSPEVVSDGRLLTAGVYNKLTPGFELNRDAMEARSMGGEEITLVSPLYGLLSNTTPTLYLLNPPQKSALRFELFSPDQTEAFIPQESLSCGDMLPGFQAVLCSTPYPSSLPVGVGGEPLIFTFQTEAMESSAMARLQLAEDDVLSALKLEIQQIEGLSLDQNTTLFLKARLLHQKRFYSDALDVYRDLWKTDPSPAILMAIGDIFRICGSLTLASKYYEKTRTYDIPPYVRAQAYMGSARALIFDSGAVALANSRSALEIFTKLKADGGVEQAQSLIRQIKQWHSDL